MGTVRIYWFDDEDTGGGCRIPASFRILYLEDNEWKAVYSHDPISITKDGWDQVDFEPVETSSLRLEITFQEGVSAGIIEWEVE